MNTTGGATQSRLSDIDRERYRLINDLLTQIITLGTGAVVLVTTFLEQFAKHEQVGWLAILALVVFALSILAGLYSKWQLATLVSAIGPPAGSPSPAKIAARAFWWTSTSFFLAILCLVGFGVVNLWNPPSK